ncbi:hypothetical protein OsI_00713 [Oryza sativa Indica Group]|uniref:Uncharacterized protein n=1 Tax=Oryza sativa subsp. indica TaxID=39946 RepID=B8ADN9_ORYSI|nr:hypothetical protein OsI_00713 [Oryza sativa Indica Group]
MCSNGDFSVCSQQTVLYTNVFKSQDITPFMAAAESGDVPTVEYFLDHSGDVTKADVRGCTVLHHAAGTVFVSPKIYGPSHSLQDASNVIVNNGAGSPLMSSLIYRSLKCMKLLIKAGADVNGKGTVVTPLMLAASQGGYTNFIQFLLKAGANPNIPDDDQHQKESRKVVLKAQADLLFKQKNYGAAAKIYDLEYKHACDALMDAQKIDTGNVEIERELRQSSVSLEKARELMAIPPDEQ